MKSFKTFLNENLQDEIEFQDRVKRILDSFNIKYLKIEVGKSSILNSKTDMNLIKSLKWKELDHKYRGTKVAQKYNV